MSLQLGKPAVSSSVKRSAAWQLMEDGKHSMLHVVEGDAGNLHDAFTELCNFFGLRAVDTDLVEFLQALNVTQVGMFPLSYLSRAGSLSVF